MALNPGIKIFKLLPWRLLGALFLAGCISASFFHYETEKSHRLQLAHAIQYCRQVAIQVEALSLYALERNEANPVGWALRYYRLLPTDFITPDEDKNREIKPLLSFDSSNVLEKKDYNEKTRVLKYSKVFDTNKVSGIEITYPISFIGFLGARTEFANDIYLGLVFFILFSTFYLIFRPKQTLKKNAESIPPPQNEHLELDLVTQQVLQWSDQAKAGLKDISIHIRTLLQSAQKLGSASTHSRNQVELLLQNKGDLESLIHESDTDPLMPLQPQLKQSVATASKKIEEAYQSFDEVFDVTLKMDVTISKVTNSIIKEAKLIQELKTMMASHVQKNSR